MNAMNDDAMNDPALGSIHGAHRGGALRAPGHGGLGPGAHRLRGPGLSLGRQGLRGAGPGGRRGPGASPWAGHGVIGASEARRRATLIIARIRAGEEPVPEAKKTVSIARSRRWPSATCASTWRCAASRRQRPNTRLAIERYIVPALGKRAVSSLGRSQVADLQHALRRPSGHGQPGDRHTLSRMIDQAIAWGVAGEITNPCRSAPKYRTRRRERFLTDAEFRRLGSTLDELEATGRISAHAAAARSACLCSPAAGATRS